MFACLPLSVPVSLPVCLSVWLYLFSVFCVSESQSVCLCVCPGAGVVTTRAHVHYIVTEHGIAHLFGKNFRQRAYELIRIAHPDHREQLEREAFERLKVMPSP